MILEIGLVLKAAENIQEVRERYAKGGGFGSAKAHLLFAIKHIDQMNDDERFPQIWDLEDGHIIPVLVDCLDGIGVVDDQEGGKKGGTEQIDENQISANIAVQSSLYDYICIK